MTQPPFSHIGVHKHSRETVKCAAPKRLFTDLVVWAAELNEDVQFGHLLSNIHEGR